MIRRLTTDKAIRVYTAFGMGLAFCGGALLGALTAGLLMSRAWSEQAVKNGAGYYHPSTRKFHWIERPAITVTPKRVFLDAEGNPHTEEVVE